ncbi:MAG: hypothetical protein MJE77_07910 [Proteobacteria bacterium]|nr:hypothetical protein [Pseudomonadota bacterium]
MRCKNLVLTVVFAFSQVGCIDTDNDEVTVGYERKSLVSLNALAFNKLSGNKLSGNSLATHKLAINRLTDGTLVAGDLEDLETTEGGRELLTYIAQCALNEGDTLEATHSSTTYQFPGLLGLAPNWETTGISANEQELVSACLVGHVNAFGISVTISARVIDELLADATELSTYQVYEGTFFGQVFVADQESDPIYTYSCQGDDYDIASAHSPAARADRVCTDGDTGCGDIVSLGRCRDVCDDYSDRYGWKNCWGGGVKYTYTMSVFLVDANPDNEDETCGSGSNCTSPALATEAANTGTRAILSCRDSNHCTATCEDDDLCTLDGADSTGDFTANVNSGAKAKVDAFNANNAKVYCDDIDNAGTECEADCKSAGTCDLECTNGASCLLECSGATTCSISSCHEIGGATSCGGGVWVCGRTCP